MSDVLVLSCYELGRPPSGAASPLAWLHRAGIAEAEGIDLSVAKLSDEQILRAKIVGISTPMHTALVLGVRLAERIRRLNPKTRICFLGLYAHLNSEHLLSMCADYTIGGESEEVFVQLVRDILEGGQGVLEYVSRPGRPAAPVLKSLKHPVPLRRAFGPLDPYAGLEHAGKTQLAGYAEASRGCKHLCAHCPVPPVYGGKFFVLPVEAVLSDIQNQVEAGARHISFGDPDFLNGPAHARRVARALHAGYPDLTFDFTAKVEHLLAHKELVKECADSGCLFVVSAIESLSDTVLKNLRKGHTREDVFRMLKIVRQAGLTMRPSLVSFTPWTTLEDYVEVLDWVKHEKLYRHVDPVHYAIRLLIPPGSPLTQSPEMMPHLTELKKETFSYEWAHPDARMDQLQKDVMTIVERGAEADDDLSLVFARVRETALALLEKRVPRRCIPPLPDIPKVPRLTESWFCCAEPTRSQLNAV